ncbi:vitamin D3 receptor A isoform X2 [Magallana gigas]|uniref:vitamin D3 receptor A isoform X2 n=1 Tax=Magallana gigas TaxID=29159 RepID=UPI00333E6BF6
MVFETTLQCVLEAGVGSIHGEASMERFATESSSDGSSFMIEDDLPFGEVSAVEDETNSSELSEFTENGLLTLSLNEFVLNESPCAGRDSQEELNYGLSEFGLPNTTSLECFELGLGECTQELSENKDLFSSDLFNPGKNDVSNIQSDQAEEVSMSKGDSLSLTDCLNSDRDFEKPDQTEIKTSLPKMMELVDFILNMEGIKDFYSASKMTDEIMEEIVENAISASEASGSSCASSPSTGEVLHCPDTPCGQDSNYSKKNRSIKSVVSKAKDPSTKSSFLPPCRVCGDNASGFHYGANTCEACKGFFRRSIVKIQQNKESYKCIGKGEGCVLGPGKRNPCAACRYARCLEVGMSIGAIKTGRYTYEKRTKDTVEVRKMKVAEKPRQMETYISDSEVDQIIQSLKEVLLKSCPEAHTIFDRETNLNRQWQIYNEYKAKVEIFGTMSVIPKEVWDEFYKETGIDLDNRQDLMKEMACRMEHGLTMMVDFVRTIPGFADLSVSDQTELIKASHFEFFFLMLHKSFNPELRVVSGMIGLHESEINKVAEKEAIENLFQFSTSLKNLDLAFDEIILVRGICVTFADRCQLEDPKAVEQIQWRLINALRVLAKRKNYRPEQRLWHILDRLTALRTMTEISKELDKQKCSWPVMKEHPLVLDILQS